MRPQAAECTVERDLDRVRLRSLELGDLARGEVGAVAEGNQIAVAQDDSTVARGYYRNAISKDDTDWKLWYDLSTTTSGAESNHALAEAVRLNRYAKSDFEAGDVPG